jgi:predicted nucleotidyltransferase
MVPELSNGVMLSPAAKTKISPRTRRAGGGALAGARPRQSNQKTVRLAVDEIVRRLEPYCREHGIIRLEIFGSMARGDMRSGSDVDLIATFRKIPGLHYFSMEKEMTQILGVSVDLLLAEDVEEMTNPYRKVTIQRDRRTIYAA